MKITVTQLRRIIKEEVARTIHEAPKKKNAAAEAEYTKRAIEYFESKIQLWVLGSLEKAILLHHPSAIRSQ